ncbi:hypothetical protein LWC34_12565 [Kibdelosporangium philippinense]|uniref:Uncharacterized protein n=1 Tax=Kibdelosporangium philippinense TaxID=211113 RepID=A0ABS8Z8B3_9PSEU|nr:hypothetical protein [Kibdelosporangium philippinense]MCE7003652.1 hypothetical protein [Kibdelosporangium philippinense]
MKAATAPTKSPSSLTVRSTNSSIGASTSAVYSATVSCLVVGYDRRLLGPAITLEYLLDMFTEHQIEIDLR